MKFYLIITLGLALSAFMRAEAALTTAFVTEIENNFWAMDYNCAKIRQACLKVHGEKWFKKNIVLDRKYRQGVLSISNTNFMEILFRGVDPEDLMELKEVIDYMASRNDTLYIPVSRDYFEQIYNSPYALNEYMRKHTSSYFDFSVMNGSRNFLRVGEVPDRIGPDLTIIQFETFYLGNGCVGDLLMEYREKCEKEGYMDLSHSHFEKEKVRKEDINLYYDYTVASDKLLLKTRPERKIPIDVRYDTAPNEQGLYIRWKYYPYD